MKKRHLLPLTGLIALAAGCHSVAPVADSELAGVYTRGVITVNRTGRAGFLEPFLDVDPTVSQITIETASACWISPYRREDDTLVLENSREGFPKKFRISREPNGPVLYSREGNFLHPVHTAYGKRHGFPRPVGKPVPPEVKVVLDRERELTPGQRQLLKRTVELYLPVCDFSFSRIVEKKSDGSDGTVIDAPGQVRVIRQDPARLSGAPAVLQGPRLLLQSAEEQIELTGRQEPRP